MWEIPGSIESDWKMEQFNSLNKTFNTNLKEDYPGIQIKNKWESKWSYQILLYKWQEVELSSFPTKEQLSNIRDKFGPPRQLEQLQDKGFSINNLTADAKIMLESASIPVKQLKWPDGRINIKLGGNEFRISSPDMAIPINEDGSITIADSKNLHFSHKDGNKNVFLLTMKDGNQIRLDFDTKQQNNTITPQRIENNLNQPNLSFMRLWNGAPNYEGTLNNIDSISQLMQNGYRFNDQDWNTIVTAMFRWNYGTKKGFNKIERMTPVPNGWIEVVLGKNMLTFQEGQQYEKLTKEWYAANQRKDTMWAINLQNQINELKRPKQQALYITSKNWRDIL